MRHEYLQRTDAKIGHVIMLQQLLMMEVTESEQGKIEESNRCSLDINSSGK